MGFIVRQSTGSGCCACEQQVSPCACGGGCVLQCRSVSGVAELCGYNEFASPSVPPRRYRRAELTRDFEHAQWSGTTCEGTSSGGAVYTGGGANTIDAMTCAETRGAWTKSQLSGGPTAPTVPAATPVSCSPADTCEMTRTCTQTTLWEVGKDACCDDPAPGTNRRADRGVRGWVLSEPDMDEDALARAVPQDANEWPVIDCAEAVSFRTQRGAGQFAFTFRSVQVRAAISNPVAGGIYNITVYTVERPLASGAEWSDPEPYAVLQVQADDDPQTVDWTDWVELPTDAGVEIRTAHCTVERLG